MLFLRYTSLFSTSVCSDVSSSAIVAELCVLVHLSDHSGRLKVKDMAVSFLQLYAHAGWKPAEEWMNESFVLEGAGAVLLMAALRDGRLCLD